MKLLITGGTGFFGKAILRHLMQKYRTQSPLLATQVTVLSRTPANFIARNPEFANQKWLSLHRGDVGIPDSLPNDTNFTHILHAAADSTDTSALTHLQRYDQIVEGTRNLLKLALKVGAKRFLLTSSGGAYGPQPPESSCIPETYLGMPDPLNANNVYGVAKRQAEHLCALYREQYGVGTIIARCFAFIGEDLPLDVHFAIGNFIRDALWNEEIVVAGDGTPLRSYLAQQDLAHWLLTLLESGESGRAYNVGSDKAISIAQLAHLVRDIISPNKPVRILGKVDETKSRNRYIPDIKRARDELGLDITIPLEDAIQAVAVSASSRKNCGKLSHRIIY
ncbi:MAG: NAD(P)-dependent oxidoreductase [Azonexus sp.]